MVKYNRVSLARKKELEQPDEFIEFSKRMINLGIKYKTQISASLGIILAIVVVIFVIRYFSNLTEDKAFTQLHDAIKKYEATQKSDSSDKLNEDIVSEFKTVIDKYPRTVAGNLSRTYLANMYFNFGKYDDSIKLYEKSMSYYKKSPSLRNVVLSGLGYCYEAKADYEAAIKYFEMITKGQSDVSKDEALFNLGRIYGKMGNNEKRIEMLKEIVNNYKDSVYFNLAQESTLDQQT